MERMWANAFVKDENAMCFCDGYVYGGANMDNMMKRLELENNSIFEVVDLKHKKLFINRCGTNELKLFCYLLTKNIYVNGFVSSEGGFCFYNKKVFKSDDVLCNSDNLMIEMISDNVYEAVISSSRINNQQLFCINKKLINKKIYIYGYGYVGRKVKLELESNWGIEISGIIDKKIETFEIKDGTEFIPLDDLNKKINDDWMIIACCFDLNGMKKALEERLNDKSLSQVVYAKEFTDSKVNLQMSFSEFCSMGFFEIYNFFYFSHINKNRKIVIYGDLEDNLAFYYANLLQLLDIPCETVYDDYIDEPEELLGYQCRNVYDLIYHESKRMVLIAKKNYKKAYELLKSIGYEYQKDCFVVFGFRSDRYILRNNVLDINLGYTYLQNCEFPGFTIFGKNSKNDYKIVVLGGSTADAELYGYQADKSWIELFYEKIDCKDITVFSGGVAGYDSSQELIKLIRDVLVIKPDLVISYDGFNDSRAINEYPFIHGYQKNLFESIKKLTQVTEYGFENNTDYVNYGLRNTDSNVQKWIQHICIMKSICEINGIKFLSFLQPMLSTKKEKDCIEKSLWNMAKVVPAYRKLGTLSEAFRTEGKKIENEYDFIIDLSDIFDFQHEVYSDEVHLTQKGNDIIASRIWDELKNKYQIVLCSKKYR